MDGVGWIGWIGWIGWMAHLLDAWLGGWRGKQGEAAKQGDGRGRVWVRGVSGAGAGGGAGPVRRRGRERCIYIYTHICMCVWERWRRRTGSGVLNGVLPVLQRRGVSG